MISSAMSKKRGTKKEIDMLHGPLLKRMVLFALPLAASSILQMLFSMADTAVVGQFAGSKAMAAVGGNVPMINLLVSLFVGLSIGVNVVIARLIGENKKDQIGQAVYTSVVLAAVSGVLLMVSGLLLARPLLEITGVPEDVMPLAMLYLRIYFVGTPFTVMYNFCSSILRSKGDSARPLYILMFTGCINVGLNLVLVILLHMSVAGVAIATMTANFVSACIILYMLRHEEEPFRLRLRGQKISKKVIINVIRIGLPAGLQGVVFSVSNTVIQSGINSLGSAAIAGNAAALNFEGIGYFALNAFNQTAVTFTSQNYGAGEAERCRKIFVRALVCGMFTSMALNLTCFGFRNFLLGLFTSEALVLEIGKIRMGRVLVLQWIASLYEISGSALRGMGYSMTPTILTIAGTCVLRILWVLVIFPTKPTLEVLLGVYPITWAITSVLVLCAYFLIRRKEFRRMELEK